jgi:hypothetical protein
MLAATVRMRAVWAYCRRVVWYVITNVSEEHTASIFVKEALGTV